MSKVLARMLVIGGVVYFVGSVIAMHLLRPDVGPLRQGIWLRLA